MPFSKKIFSQRLRALRTENHLSQEQLGKIIGFKVGSVSNLETQKGSPSIEIFCALADHLGVSLDHLAGYDRPPDDIPRWLKAIYPDLLSLGPDGRKAVKAIVQSLTKK